MTARKSKPEKDPMIDKATRKKKLIRSSILVVIAIIIGAGIIVNNISEIYMLDKNTATITTPLKVMRGGDNAFLITTYDIDGTPADGLPVNVDMEYKGKTYHLYSGKTDSTGSVQPVCKVPGNGKEGDRAKLIIRAGSEKITKNVVLDTPIKVFISTDKPIYQPLQTIHIRALCFESSVPLTTEDSVQVEIMDPDGNKIFKDHYTPNEFGIINLDYTLSDQLPLGNYKIMVDAEGAIEEKNVLVKEYVLPKFKIELEDTRSWYTINEYIKGNVTCNYFFGKEVDGKVIINVKAYYGIWETVEMVNGDLKNGRFEFSIEPTKYAVGMPYNADNGYLEVNITVTDSAGHSETKTKMISIARKPILLTLLADSNVVGTISNHYLIARYPDGMPVINAKVVYESNTVTTTDERGIAQINFMYNNQRYLDIEVSDKNTTVKESYYISGTKGIKVIPDKTYYDVGELANIEVIYTGGNSVTKWVYYDVLSRGFIVKTGHEKLEDNKVSFSIPITSDMAPLAEIRVYKTQKDLNVVNDIALFGIGTTETDINVSIEIDKELYTPNDDITFQFTVTDSGDPVQAALGLAFVDQSVFEIHERFSGFEKIIHDLESEFITPQYQICNYVYSPDSPLGEIPDKSSSIVSQEELSVTGKNSMFVVTGTSHYDYSLQLENYYVTYFWHILFFLGLVGFIALFVLALKYRKAAAIVVVLLFLLPLITIVLAGVLYVWVSGFGTGGDSGLSSGGMQDADSWRRDGDEWDELNAPPKDAKKKGSGGEDSTALSYGGPRISDIDLPSLPGDDEPGATGDDTTGMTKPVQVRQYFPETWYWNPSLITDENGKASLSLATPDTMTTWNVEAVASTKDARFGLGTKNVTVFKGFFIEPDIPVSVVRNDEFPLKILIYNYANLTRDVTVTLHQANWYELLSDSNIANIRVNASSVSSVDFRISAKEVGIFNITVDGDNGKIVDRVAKEMQIVPDGKPVVELVNGGLDNNQTVNATITLLDDRIPNSTNAYVKLQGGLEAVTLDGAESYIHFVSGCGEQSTSKLSLTVSAYKNAIKGSYTDEQLFEWENKVAQGIEHELLYLTDVPSCNGKAIAWHTGQSPDIWLTAWAIFVFKDLSDVGFDVDEDIIPGMQNYLISEQQSDGSYIFPDAGHWSINSKLQSEQLVSTAYITRALLYSGYDKTSSDITNSINYIEEHTKLDDDPYTIALVLLSLEMADGNNDIRKSLASMLVELRHEDKDEGTVAWAWTSAEEHNYDHRHGGATIIETTGYSVMALNNHGGYSHVVRKAVKYLLTRRSGGCYGTTHDTAVAFQALNTIDEISIDNLMVTVYSGNEEIESIRFTDYNKDITYLIDLRPYIDPDQNKLEITLESTGNGSILYQVYSEQYLPWDENELNIPPELELKVDYDTTTIKVNDKITAEVSIKYNGSTSMLKMVLIDLRAPVGFSFFENDFSKLLEQKIISNYEIRGRQALVYLDNVIKGNNITFNYSLLANNPIKGTIQGVHAYDMYDPNIDTELAPVEIESYI